MKKIAICYDFDGTFMRGNMQENSFIPEIGMNPASFWDEVKENAKENNMDEILSYMQLMIEKAKEKKKPFSKETIKKHGENAKFFPGVPEWFEEINDYAKEKKVKLEHYIISSGLDDMIRGSKIGTKFTYIFASGFVYDANDVAVFPARSVNYTTKTQYLFRINKGVKNSWNNKTINKTTPKDKLAMPFSRMIYIGDGETDVPAMKMINYKGGYSIAVYPYPKGQRRTKDEMEAREKTQKLKSDNRVQFVAEADYTKGKELYNIVSAIINRIVDEENHKMNRKAFKN